MTMMDIVKEISGFDVQFYFCRKAIRKGIFPEMSLALLHQKKTKDERISMGAVRYHKLDCPANLDDTSFTIVGKHYPCKSSLRQVHPDRVARNLCPPLWIWKCIPIKPCQSTF